MELALWYVFGLALLTNGVFAGGYLPQSKAAGENCNAVTVYTRKNFCEKKTGETCLSVPKDFSCEYSKLEDNFVDGAEILEITQSEPCNLDCEEKRDNLVCLDIEAFSNHDGENVFCQKVTGYEQVLQGKKIGFDMAIKATKDAEKQAEKDAKAAAKANHESLRAKMEGGEDLTKDELRAYLLKLH